MRRRNYHITTHAIQRLVERAMHRDLLDTYHPEDLKNELDEAIEENFARGERRRWKGELQWMVPLGPWFGGGLVAVLKDGADTVVTILVSL